MVTVNSIQPVMDSVAWGGRIEQSTCNRLRGSEMRGRRIQSVLLHVSFWVLSESVGIVEKTWQQSARWMQLIVQLQSFSTPCLRLKHKFRVIVHLLPLQLGVEVKGFLETTQVCLSWWLVSSEQLCSVGEGRAESTTDYSITNLLTIQFQFPVNSD